MQNCTTKARVKKTYTQKYSRFFREGTGIRIGYRDKTIEISRYLYSLLGMPKHVACQCINDELKLIASRWGFPVIFNGRRIIIRNEDLVPTLVSRFKLNDDPNTAGLFPRVRLIDGMPYTVAIDMKK